MSSVAPVNRHPSIPADEAQQIRYIVDQQREEQIAPDLRKYRQQLSSQAPSTRNAVMDQTAAPFSPSPPSKGALQFDDEALQERYEIMRQRQNKEREFARKQLEEGAQKMSADVDSFFSAHQGAAQTQMSNNYELLHQLKFTKTTNVLDEVQSRARLADRERLEAKEREIQQAMFAKQEFERRKARMEAESHETRNLYNSKFVRVRNIDDLLPLEERERQQLADGELRERKQRLTSFEKAKDGVARSEWARRGAHADAKAEAMKCKLQLMEIEPGLILNEKSKLVPSAQTTAKGPNIGTTPHYPLLKERSSQLNSEELLRRQEIQELEKRSWFDMVEQSSAFQVDHVLQNHQSEYSLAVNDNILRDNAAVKIQSTFRGHHTRKELKEQRGQLNEKWIKEQQAKELADNAVVKSHPPFAGTRSEGKGSREPDKASEISMVIDDSLVKDKAATKIQSSYRGHHARNEVKRKRAEMNARWVSEKESTEKKSDVIMTIDDSLVRDSAAVKIQSTFRGHHARNDVKRMRSEANAKWVSEQDSKNQGNSLSPPIAAKKFQTFLSPDDAAVKIQSSYRGHHTRAAIVTKSDDGRYVRISKPINTPIRTDVAKVLFRSRSQCTRSDCNSIRMSRNKESQDNIVGPAITSESGWVVIPQSILEQYRPKTTGIVSGEVVSLSGHHSTRAIEAIEKPEELKDITPTAKLADVEKGHDTESEVGEKKSKGTPTTDTPERTHYLKCINAISKAFEKSTVGLYGTVELGDLNSKSTYELKGVLMQLHILQASNLEFMEESTRIEIGQRELRNWVQLRELCSLLALETHERNKVQNEFVVQCDALVVIRRRIDDTARDTHDAQLTRKPIPALPQQAPIPPPAQTYTSNPPNKAYPRMYAGVHTLGNLPLGILPAPPATSRPSSSASRGTAAEHWTSLTSRTQPTPEIPARFSPHPPQWGPTSLGPLGPTAMANVRPIEQPYTPLGLYRPKARSGGHTKNTGLRLDPLIAPPQGGWFV